MQCCKITKEIIWTTAEIVWCNNTRNRAGQLLNSLCRSITRFYTRISDYSEVRVIFSPLIRKTRYRQQYLVPSSLLTSSLTSDANERGLSHERYEVRRSCRWPSQYDNSNTGFTDSEVCKQVLSGMARQFKSTQRQNQRNTQGELFRGRQDPNELSLEKVIKVFASIKIRSRWISRMTNTASFSLATLRISGSSRKHQ